MVSIADRIPDSQQLLDGLLIQTIPTEIAHDSPDESPFGEG
jgi:hypothetical protein